MRINMKFEYFLFKDVFNFKRGSRLTEENQVYGDIAYISSTKFNNGISNYINPPDFMTVYKNTLTLSNSGSVCHVFFHDYDFVASDHVTVLSLKEESIVLNKYIALYFKPIIESMRYKYNFGREISDARLSEEYIKLPVDENGDIDWIFMENFMRDLEESVSYKNEYISTNSSFENSNVSVELWGDFLIGGPNGLFSIEKGQETQVELSKNSSDSYPLIGASEYNNGYIGTFGGYKKLFKGNVITVSSNGAVGKAFYQENDFIATGDVNILSLKNYELNKYIALFLCVIIEQESFRYNWGIKWGKGKMEKSKIKLPVDSEGNPDFKFMEEFIKLLPYSDNL